MRLPKDTRAPRSRVECSCHVKTRPRKHTVRCRMLLFPRDCGKGHCLFPQPDPGCQQQCCHCKVPGITFTATLQRSQVVCLNKCRAGSGLISRIEIHMPPFLVLSVELGMEPRSLLGRLSTSEPHSQPVVETFERFCAPCCYLEISAVIRTIASLVYYISEETLPMTITTCVFKFFGYFS